MPLKKVFGNIFLGSVALAAISVFLLFLGFGFQTITPMPSYAYVYLDDKAKTYIALPCLEEWHRRANEGEATLRLSKIGEARELKYKGDARCRETGAFLPAGRSITGNLLVRLGILKPLEYWWDQPFRREDGKVVLPKP